MAARFSVEVERFAVAQHDAAEIALDEMGMLAIAGSAGIAGTGLVKVSDLAHEGSFCLLGEPGAGKTTALHAVVRGVPDVDDARAGQDSVLWVPLAQVADSGTFRERVIRPIVGRVRATRAAQPTHLTVVLDGLDECPISGGGKVLAGLLKELLGNTDFSALRVLIGCRSAEYPQSVHDVLAGALESFGRYELAPLSRRDVQELAASRGADADEFLREIKRTATGPLACLPLSLDLLLRSYSLTSGLRGSAADLYETALRALAGEPDPDRDPARVSVPGEQAFVIASRLCCYLLLCGKAAFWTGQSGQVPEGDLDPYSLAGGQERQAGGIFPVTRQVIDAALRSGLFTARGPRRVVPAHAAFAGFLGARYLTLREVPDIQLQTLLTVSTPAGSGIIPALRETTAWLIALRPQAAAWVSDSDLARLAAYAAIIPDTQVRSLLTERMLSDPGAFFSGGWRWARNLAHPGLAAQLLPILTALAEPSAAQPTRERSYLAVTLASEADATAVLPLLLAIAARSDLDASLRAMAARTAAGLDMDGAVPVLEKMIAEITAHPERDPDDEIRGTALDALWPRHLTARELVSSLTRPKRDNLVGAYFMFRSSLPARISDGDVPHLLHSMAAGDEAERSGNGSSARPYLAGEGLLASLVDRAFTCQDPTPLTGLVAAVVVERMRDYDSLEVPAALDERDASGTETRRSQQLRRQLAAELIGRNSSQPDIGQLLVWGWEPACAAQDRHMTATSHGLQDYPPARRGLVDAADLEWVVGMAMSAGPNETQAFVSLLRTIYDPMDPHAQEAADRVRGTALWPAFAFWFDPVALGSEAAELHKRAYVNSRPRQTAWDAAPAHIAEVFDLYERAPGDATAFANLLYLLQIDPAIGRGTHSLDGDLTDRPGIRILPPGEWPGRLTDASRNYLAQATPPGPEQLDQPGTLSWLAEVGYLALAYLMRREQAGAGSTIAASDMTGAWAVSVLAFPGRGDGIRRALLASLAKTAPDSFPHLIERLIAAHLDTGTWPTRLEDLDAAWTSRLGEILAQCIHSAIQTLAQLAGPVQARGGAAASQHGQKISAVSRTVTILVRILAQHVHPAGVQAALDVIDRATDAQVGDQRVLAARAAAVGLLAGDAARYWDVLTSRLAGAPILCKAVLEDLADDTASPVLPRLTDSQLAALWTQLAEYWRYQDDPSTWSSGYVGGDEQARRFRDGVLATLKGRGTSNAVSLLRRLAESNPALPWLAGQVREAEETHRGQQWEPLLPADLTRMLEDSDSRLVRSSADLADLVARSINAAAEELARTGQLLWNSSGSGHAERWRPKSEPDVGAWLSERLTERLARSKVVVNREVLVRQTSAGSGLGLTVDIQADAPAARAEDIEPARCRIELKGNWNQDLMTAMRSQLADDYLIPDGLQYGIYVTAWFDAQLWNDESDSRRRKAASRGRDDTEQKLATQAESLLELGLQILSVIIDIPRPAPSARAAAP
jgi:NACHT domain